MHDISWHLFIAPQGAEIEIQWLFATHLYVSCLLSLVALLLVPQPKHKSLLTGYYNNSIVSLKRRKILSSVFNAWLLPVLPLSNVQF